MVTSSLIFQAVYIFCLIYGMLSDARNLMIPNWVPFLLIITFFAYSLSFWPDIDLLPRLATSALVFLLGFVVYNLNWFGGGDLKLLTAVSLWIGPDHIIAFSLLMAGLGSLLGLLLLTLRWAVKVRGALSPERLPKSVRRWLEEGACPYGIAIATAALVMAPSVLG
jgi:prepilin peptidase CpaA